MKRLYFFLFTIIFTVSSSFTRSSQAYMIGDSIKDFSVRNAVNNSLVSLNDFEEHKGLVVIFSSNSCPYSKVYDERIIRLAKKYQEKGIGFLVLNPSLSGDEDTPESMKKWASEKNYPFPFAIDKGQKITRQFGASKLPESYLLKNMQGNFILQYKGAIDDNPQTHLHVSERYLEDAIISILNDEAVRLPVKRATGCLIR